MTNVLDSLKWELERSISSTISLSLKVDVKVVSVEKDRTEGVL